MFRSSPGSTFSLVCQGQRSFSVSSPLPKKLTDYFATEKKLADQYKRPSDLEIQLKGLPKNTPNIIQRLARDSHTTLYSEDKRLGYHHGPTGTWRDFYSKDVTLHEVLTEGFATIKKEVKTWVEEVKRGGDQKWPFEIIQGKIEYVWKFQTDEDRKEWTKVCDSDWGEGYSSVMLGPSASGRTTLFSGEIVTRLPPDGRIAYAGYANMKSNVKVKSFVRIKSLDWGYYSHLVIRLRGDGRSYMVNLHNRDHYDLFFHDLWSFPLHTRGGPYWQTFKIPFNKFYLNVRGCIQDTQTPPPLEDLVSLGITLFDDIDGPFALELDYIGVVADRHFREPQTHVYETYVLPRAGYDRE